MPCEKTLSTLVTLPPKGCFVYSLSYHGLRARADLAPCLVAPSFHDPQVGAINARLLGCMRSNWGLLAELSQLRNFYLMASPTMQVMTGGGGA